MTRVDGFLQVRTQDCVQLRCRVEWLLDVRDVEVLLLMFQLMEEGGGGGRKKVKSRDVLYLSYVLHNRSANLKGFKLIISVVISQARYFAVDISTAEIFSGNDLARRSFNLKQTNKPININTTECLHPSIVTRGGPARKTVPLPLTITFSSDIAGTYAPPAVQEPKTRATWERRHWLGDARLCGVSTCGMPLADILA